MKKLLALCSLALAVPAVAESEMYASHEHWEVYAMEGPECTLVGQFEDDTTLFVIYSPDEDNVMLAVGDENMRSLKVGAEYQMKTVFVHNASKTLDDGWGTKPFTARRFSDGMPYLSRSFDGRVMLDDIAKNDIIGFSYNDTVIKSLSLNGSSVAVRKLRECAFKQAGLSPKDPFAGQPHPEQPKDPFAGLPEPNATPLRILDET
jgi:hypothetical protein